MEMTKRTPRLWIRRRPVEETLSRFERDGIVCMYHRAYVLDGHYGPCYRYDLPRGGAITVIDVPPLAAVSPGQTYRLQVHGDLPSDDHFTLIIFTLLNQQYWIVGKTVGEPRVIDEVSTGESTVVFKKLAVGELRRERDGNLPGLSGVYRFTQHGKVGGRMEEYKTVRPPLLKQKLKLEEFRPPIGRARPIVYWRAEMDSWIEAN